MRDELNFYWFTLLAFLEVWGKPILGICACIFSLRYLRDSIKKHYGDKTDTNE